MWKMARTGFVGLCVVAISLGIGVGIGRAISVAVARQEEAKNGPSVKRVASLVASDLSGPQPKLASVKEFTFGEIETPFVGTATWVLKNEGKIPLKIRTDGVSCGCTSPTLETGKKATIEPGKEYKYTANFNHKKGTEPIRRVVQLSTSDPKAEHIELVLTATPKTKPSL